MPWNNQGGGGPWGGGGPRGGGPWGSGPSGGGGGSQPPDLEDLLRKGQDRFRKIMPGGGFGTGKGIAIVALVLIGLWLASGFYRVGPDEQGVELRFGELIGTTQPGLNYNWPWPIGFVKKPKVTIVNREEIGFVTRGGGVSNVNRESLMLTGDENIIDIQFVVFWVIKDAGEYLFNIRNPDRTVKNVAESVMRELIGRSGFEYVRTTGRAKIQGDARTLIQDVLDNYGAGIQIEQVEMQKVDPPASVIDAFRDVQAARADKERAINEAQAYANEKTEKAQGRSQQIVREAEAFKEETINRATGDSERFISILREYEKAPEITRRRIYLQTMEEVLGGMDKVLLESDGAGGNAVPYVSLNELVRDRENQRNRAPRGAATTGDRQ